MLITTLPGSMADFLGEAGPWELYPLPPKPEPFATMKKQEEVVGDQEAWAGAISGWDWLHVAAETGDTAGNVPERVSPAQAPPTQGSLPRLLPHFRGRLRLESGGRGVRSRTGAQ